MWGGLSARRLQDLPPDELWARAAEWGWAYTVHPDLASLLRANIAHQHALMDDLAPKFWSD